METIPISYFVGEKQCEVDSILTIESGPKDVVFVSTEDHTILVLDSTTGKQWKPPISTVDSAVSLCYCAKGDFIACLEERRDSVTEKAKFVRVYLNWRNENRAVPISVRIAGSATPAAGVPRTSLEVLEIRTGGCSALSCCQMSGNVAVATGSTVTIYSLLSRQHELADWRYCDFEECIRLEFDLTVVSVRLCENILAACDTKSLRLCHILWTASISESAASNCDCVFTEENKEFSTSCDDTTKPVLWDTSRGRPADDNQTACKWLPPVRLSITFQPPHCIETIADQWPRILPPSPYYQQQQERRQHKEQRKQKQQEQREQKQRCEQKQRSEQKQQCDGVEHSPVMDGGVCDDVPEMIGTVKSEYSWSVRSWFYWTQLTESTPFSSAGSGAVSAQLNLLPSALTLTPFYRNRGVADVDSEQVDSEGFRLQSSAFCRLRAVSLFFSDASRGRTYLFRLPRAASRSVPRGEACADRGVYRGQTCADSGVSSGEACVSRSVVSDVSEHESCAEEDDDVSDVFECECNTDVVCAEFVCEHVYPLRDVRCVVRKLDILHVLTSSQLFSYTVRDFSLFRRPYKPSLLSSLPLLSAVSATSPPSSAGSSADFFQLGWRPSMSVFVPRRICLARHMCATLSSLVVANLSRSSGLATLSLLELPARDQLCEQLRQLVTQCGRCVLYEAHALLTADWCQPGEQEEGRGQDGASSTDRSAWRSLRDLICADIGHHIIKTSTSAVEVAEADFWLRSSSASLWGTFRLCRDCSHFPSYLLVAVGSRLRHSVSAGQWDVIVSWLVDFNSNSLLAEVTLSPVLVSADFNRHPLLTALLEVVKRMGYPTNSSNNAHNQLQQCNLAMNTEKEKSTNIEPVVEAKQTDGEQKQTDGEQKQTDVEQKHSGGEQKQTDGEQKQTDVEQKQTDGEQKRSGGEQKQTDVEQKQTDGEQKQIDGEQKQTDGEQKQTGGEQKQTDGEQKQTGGEQKRSGGEQEQPDREQKQTDGEQKQPDREQKQTDGEQKRSGGEQKQTDVEQKQQQMVCLAALMLMCVSGTGSLEQQSVLLGSIQPAALSSLQPHLLFERSSADRPRLSALTLVLSRRHTCPLAARLATLCVRRQGGGGATGNTVLSLCDVLTAIVDAASSNESDSELCNSLRLLLINLLEMYYLQVSPLKNSRFNPAGITLLIRSYLATLVQTHMYTLTLTSAGSAECDRKGASVTESNSGCHDNHTRCRQFTSRHALFGPRPDWLQEMEPFDTAHGHLRSPSNTPPESAYFVDLYLLQNLLYCGIASKRDHQFVLQMVERFPDVVGAASLRVLSSQLDPALEVLVENHLHVVVVYCKNVCHSMEDWGVALYKLADTYLERVMCAAEDVDQTRHVLCGALDEIASRADVTPDGLRAALPWQLAEVSDDIASLCERAINRCQRFELARKLRQQCVEYLESLI